MNADSSKGENVNNQIFEFYVDVSADEYYEVMGDSFDLVSHRLNIYRGGKVVAVFQVWQFFEIKPILETKWHNITINNRHPDVTEIEQIVERVMARGLGNG